MAPFDKYEGAHDLRHDLVRCKELVEDVDTSMEKRLASLEERFAKHEVTMDKRLFQLESKVDHQLSGLKKMLETVLGNRGIESSQSDNAGS
jgi:uncharacterized coiled-coil protein SlyX